MSLSTEPLLTLYQRIVAGEGSLEEHIEAIRARGELARAIYTLAAVEMPQQEIDEYLDRLDVAIKGDAARDAAEDAACREFARIQFEVLQNELQRRARVARQIERGERFIPPRTDVLAALMGLSIRIVEERAEAPFGRTFQRLLEIVRRALREREPGAGLVAAVLREAEALPDEAEPTRLDPWIRAAMALRLLSDPERGFGGVTVEVDPVTAAEARRAYRIFTAVERQDRRYTALDWPMDLSAGEVADLIEAAETGSRTWTLEAQPEADLLRYRGRVTVEEAGREEPHVQITPEVLARRAAERAGGFPYPLLYHVHPRERARRTRQIWQHGISRLRREVGVGLFPVATDPQVRWGAPPHPLGLLCAVAIWPDAILHVQHKDHPDHDELFSELTRQATREAGGQPRYPQVLRDLFLRHGFQAVVRYDFPKPTGGLPGEILLLDPSPENLMVIREAVPSFVQGDRPLILPNKRRTSRGELGRILS